MKTSFPKFLSAFFLFSALCFFQTPGAAANINNGGVSVENTLAAFNASSLADIPSLSIGNITSSESGSGGATTIFSFTVVLSSASSETVTVNYTTANGTANAPGDYQSNSGTLTFAPGEAVKTIEVVVNNDVEAEPDETFAVNLFGAVNATIADAVGTGTILDDDFNTSGCTFSVSPAILNLTASASSGNTISVTTQAGCNRTATTNSSFITITSGASGSGSGTITFNVAANPGAARSGAIFIAGQVVTINQTAATNASGLRVSIIDSPDPVTVGSGQDINYTIFVFNDGPSPATGVVLTDTLPAGFGFIAATTTTGSCSQFNGTVTCNLGNLTDSATVTITARPTAPGTFTNTVGVSGNESDPNPGDNTASATTTVNPQPGTASADLRIVAFSSPGSAVTLNNESVIAYSVFVDNDGPSPATGVVLTSTLSPNLNFVSATTSNGGGCSFSSGVVTCNIGNLTSEVSVIIIARPTAPGIVTNTVNVSGNEPDPLSANNSAVLTTMINPPVGTVYADLRVTTFPLQTSTARVNLDYQIFVNNDGPSPATGVIVTVTLPSSAVFVSATPSQGICNFADNLVTCNLGTVTNAASVTITSRPTVAGVIASTASVRGNEPDFNQTNNSFTTVTTINPANKGKRFRAF